MQVFNITDQVINKKYKILHQINKGSFGLLFKAKDIETDIDLAVKVEPYSLSKKYLLKEARILNLLQKGHHIPRIHWCGCKMNTTFLVMELLGKNLDDLLKECNRKFSLKTVLMIADQMLSALEFIHTKGYIHRDLNPRNICVGLADKASTLYSIDFGLSSTYRDLTINDKLKENFPFIGTLNFASVNSHKGLEQTCIDDLESLFYVIIYSLTGTLPWENISNEKIDLKKKIEEIKEEKIKVTLQELCAELPEELKECVEYIRNLEFYKKPDYKFLRKNCEKLYRRKYGEYDFQYDWSRNEDCGLPEKAQLSEKAQLKHHRKFKMRPVKEEQKNNSEGSYGSNLFYDEKHEEQKCEIKCKKQEEENIRRKNSFANVNNPDQIYHIKKKVKTDNAVNLIEKSSAKNEKPVPEEKAVQSKSPVKDKKKEDGQSEVNNEKQGKNEDSLKKEEEKKRETNDCLEDKKLKEHENPKSNDSESSGEIEKEKESLKLQTTIKKKFDLLFGKEDSSEKEKDNGGKSYCKIF